MLPAQSVNVIFLKFITDYQFVLMPAEKLVVTFEPENLSTGLNS